jgi:hypothetical protein
MGTVSDDELELGDKMGTVSDVGLELDGSRRQAPHAIGPLQTRG